ncbi:MAG: TetR family transcriptional regulator [Pseudonocardia sp.]|nr:TetR family transcriptional regulator [Pseudonocardia sp.]
MREWIPVSTSTKGRLALAAVTMFGARPFDEVSVGDLAAAATVTTGALYHHFGSKLGLYAFVRDDVERRLLDRMEGAAEAGDDAGRSAAVAAALLVGFDFAVREGFLHLLGAPPAGAGHDRLAAMLTASTASPVLGRVLAAAWRAALAAVADGAPPQQARAALLAFEFRIQDG